ncbi:hypothetical protein [Bacillus sp. SJS]|uniref:hypothetical protein n=1 Tax=Bacillus sp. SJS TaxID=1423321 RepID=UPI0004DD4FD0|nr:hypothetical protein [Bacillus sp. SJS]KZZ85184.1 hypothetical protein AS29_006860 [Bacillus sp. SJS]
MSRSANYTIQGFIYQFNKTLLEVLNGSDESEITVEGIIEDIEVKTDLVTKAIQCKYHETKEKFTLSCIYKPILQMMDHFHSNSNADIEYRLFVHFPNEKIGTKQFLSSEDIETIFKSSDKNLKKLIEKNSEKNHTEFCKRFTVEFGPSLDELIKSIYKALVENGMPESDLESLIYPNSIQKIAELSILREPHQRVILKKDLLNELLKVKKASLSRWTKELRTLDKIMKLKKQQLRINLTKNSRLRYFIISVDTIENFNENIVTFICEYLTKYHFKEIHDKTPVFCLDCPLDIYLNIIQRLHRKKVKVNDGLVAGIFDKGKFIIDPVRGKISKSFYREFDLKLIHFDKEAIGIINECKCEDCFLFMENLPGELDTEDINIEHMYINEIEKIKFIMGMSDTYE